MPTLDPRNWLQWFYVPGTQGASRVRLDPNPPPGAAARMAHYFLPGCLDFKVEFTFDDPREIAVTESTGEPVLTQPIDLDGDGNPEQLPAPQAIHWQSPPLDFTGPANPQIVVWNRVPVEPSDYGSASLVNGIPTDLRDLTHPYRWPRAVRITLRVLDPAGRLPDPITYSIVHAWQ